jgi:hypothetical protein
MRRRCYFSWIERHVQAQTGYSVRILQLLGEQVVANSPPPRDAASAAIQKGEHRRSIR